MGQNTTTPFDIFSEDFPDYLKSYDALSQYFRGQLSNLSSTEKGDRFAHAVVKLVPQTDMGMEFDLPSLNSKKTRDGGIDLIAKGNNNKNLYIQSKLWIDTIGDIDSILSNFHSYSTSLEVTDNGQLTFDYGNLDSSFMVVTLSPLKNLINLYEKKSFTSKNFYKEKTKEKRL